MNRREALQMMAATGLTGITGRVANAASPTVYTGWKFDKKARERFVTKNRYPFFSQLSRSIKGSSDNKIVMLSPFFEKALGRPSVPHEQGLGDCVAHAFALGIDYLTAVQMYMQHTPERWIAECATEPLYGGSRVEIGEGVLWGDGSTGFWAAEWLITYGALLRQQYPGFDFTKYDPEMAKEMGRDGCPDSLEPIAKLHPIRTSALVGDFDSLCDAINNGYPVAVCSSVGFGMTSNYWVRDSKGFLRRRGRWGHAMLAIGFDKKSQRKGACIQNSWGNWVTGPTQHGQPKGSFWVDARTVDAMLGDGDSHALSQYVGYPRVDIPDYTIW
jgi:hypothetical protein